jgi:putative endonuclease
MPERDTRKYKKTIGALGEGIACHFLEKRGYKIIEKNYLKKWGEIDIVAKKGRSWHFVEVKTVSREDKFRPEPHGNAVSHVTNSQNEDDFRPEDNLHPLKMRRFARTVETYLAEKDLNDADWQIDAITVKLWVGEKKAKVKLIENVL